MTRKLHFAEARLAEAWARSRFKEDDRLPIGTAMAVIAGVNVALWSLIALAVKSLLF
jgi:L-alanine-DL-glutamate epimerase-like enolase superfamily enzyme